MDSSEPRPKKGRGGKRAGAGRPTGATAALAHGEVQALKTLRHRVPEGTDPKVAHVADQAFGQIVAVMRGEVSSFMGHAAAVLKASSMIREEVCGPLAQKLSVGGPNGEPMSISIDISGSSDE